MVDQGLGILIRSAAVLLLQSVYERTFLSLTEEFIIWVELLLMAYILERRGFPTASLLVV